jgi:hypothetical protein
VSDMTQEDPSRRPTMDQVVYRFEKLRLSLSKMTLSSMVVDKNEFVGKTIARAVPHWGRQFGDLVRGSLFGTGTVKYAS